MSELQNQIVKRMTGKDLLSSMKWGLAAMLVNLLVLTLGWFWFQHAARSVSHGNSGLLVPGKRPQW